MFDVETNHQHPRQAILYFLLQTRIIIRIVSVAEHTSHFQLFRFILDDVDSAESYHATKESSVLLRLYIILFDDTEPIITMISNARFS